MALAGGVGKRRLSGVDKLHAACASPAMAAEWMLRRVGCARCHRCSVLRVIWARAPVLWWLRWAGMRRG
jgi:hypothetical protein